MVATERGPDDVRALLEALKSENATGEYSDVLQRRVAAPASFAKGVPSLQAGRYLPASPMLSVRFEFAGAWQAAGIGHDWLSVAQMEEAWGDAVIQEQIGMRRRYWKHSAITKMRPEQLCLFGVNRNEAEETYAVWMSEEDEEPRFVMFAGHDEYEFDDFRAFLRFLVE
jgi:hypothetical protein